MVVHGETLTLPQSSDEVNKLVESYVMSKQELSKQAYDKDESDFEKWLDSESTHIWKTQQLKDIKKQIEDIIVTTPYCKFWPWLTRPRNVKIYYKPSLRLVSHDISRQTKNKIEAAEMKWILTQINTIPGYNAIPGGEYYSIDDHVRHAVELEISADLWKTLKNPCNSSPTNIINNDTPK